MSEKEKKALLQRVPTRMLVTSIKKDLRKTVQASGSADKPKKK